MASVELSLKSYSKIILHALKYPHLAVNGLLLCKEGNSGNTLKLVDSIPLFHQNLHLAPMLEVALMQVENYCKNSGLVIAGYYQANESLSDSSPDYVAQKVSEKIAEFFSDACLIMVDNKQLSPEMSSPAIHLMQHQEGKWKVREKSSVSIAPTVSAALSATSSLIKEKVFRQLVDFDNHLDSLGCDWLNHELNCLITDHSKN
nr:EOG090X0C9C [Eulimnadia texana]